MSLLDDVSIVVTPNGYKAGTLFAVKPTIAYGSELVVNGDFSQGATGWTIEAVWTISGGAAHGNGASGSSQELKQAILEVGKTYEFSYEIRNRVSGSVELLNSGLGSTSSNEVYKSIGIATSTELRFRPSSFNGDIYNVSVREFTGADMDVTRATAGTRVDEDGLVNYAEIIGSELVADGNFPTGTSEWGTGTGVSVGGGVATFTSTPSGQSVSQNAVATALPNGSLAKVSFEVLSRTEGSFGLYFSGTLVGSRSSVGVFTAYFTKGTETSFYIRALGTTSGTISNVSVIEEVRNNVPRIDYTGGGCPHILAEPERKNEITYSEDFSASSWTKTGSVSVSSNSVISPDGTLNGSTITGLTGSGSNDLRFVTGLNPASTTYTSSVYLKGSGTIKMKISNNVDNSGNTTITLTSSWVRYDLTHTFNATTGSLGFTLDDSGGATATTYDIWGAQLEEGSYATSYIPTSGSTVTRNQDIFTRDGIGSLIGQTEGTFFIELSKPVLNTDNYYLISLNNAASNSDDNSVTIGFDNASDDFYIRLRANASSAFTDNNRASLANTFYKIAIAYKSGQSLIYIDGNSITPNSGNLSTAFTFSATLDNLSFDYNGNNGLPFYGNVRQLQVYNTALSPTQLAALTS